jgi:predicted metal-dependent RNase
MNEGNLLQVPVYIEGMISEATGIHTAYPDYLSHEVRDQILKDGINPFESDYFTVVKQHDMRDEIVEGGPCIIMATAGMMEGGPVLEYFKRLAPDENNGLIFVSYQVSGTMGNRVQQGMGSAQLYGNDGKMEIINIALSRHTVQGFSGHSDRRQLMNYVRRLKPSPRKVYVVHGEESKCDNLARSISKLRGIRGYSPRLLDTFSLA